MYIGKHCTDFAPLSHHLPAYVSADNCKLTRKTGIPVILNLSDASFTHSEAGLPAIHAYVVYSLCVCVCVCARASSELALRLRATAAKCVCISNAPF